MNTSTSEAVWPSPVSAHQTAQSIITANTQAAYLALVASAILTSVSAGTFTASVTTTGKASADVQYAVALLNQGSYSAQVTGTSLVINW
jgi:hypothetical protein